MNTSRRDLPTEINTECIIRTLVDDLGADLVICDDDANADRTDWRQQRPTTAAAADHYNRGGVLGLVPASLHLVAVTLDPGTGCTAGDMLHDAMCEDPVLLVIHGGERQLYYRAGADAPGEPGRWRHGRIMHEGGYLILRPWNG